MSDTHAAYEPSFDDEEEEDHVEADDDSPLTDYHDATTGAADGDVSQTIEPTSETHAAAPIAAAHVEQTPTSKPQDPAREYLAMLPDAERAAIAEAAMRRGPRPEDPDWLISWAAQRAADQITADVAKLSALIEQPHEFVVHAEGVGGDISPEAVTQLSKKLDSVATQIAALPTTPNNVTKLVDPFANLAKESAALVIGIEKMRSTATAAVSDAVKQAREQMLRTAFQGHALPARQALIFHVVEIMMLLAILLTVIFKK